MLTKKYKAIQNIISVLNYYLIDTESKSSRNRMRKVYKFLSKSRKEKIAVLT